MRCARDPGLGEMYALVRSEALLAQRLSALTHQARLAQPVQQPFARAACASAVC